MGRRYISIKRKIIEKNSFIYKNYRLDFLLDSNYEVEERVNMINNFNFNKYKAITSTFFTYHDNSLEYMQPFLIKKEKPKFYKKDFFPLVKALEYFRKIGFIHGDLNRKNIIYTKDGFKIIDFEPSLKQLKNGNSQLMVTLPYIFRKNLKQNCLDSCVDKLGFFYFILRTNKKFNTNDIVSLSKDLNHSRFTKLDNNIFCKLNYDDILELAIERNKYIKEPLTDYQ